MADRLPAVTGGRRCSAPSLRRIDGRRLARAVLVLLCVLLVAAPVPSGRAQVSQDTSQPVLLSADSMTYDEGLQTVIARGNVEITQGPRTLLADTVTYNQQTEVVTASGNVALMEPTGDVLFADYLELKEEFRNGAIQGIRALLSDNSRMAASSARRRDGNRTVMRKAVYSPCNLCAEDPSRAPLWQVRAQRIVHDQEEKEISYRNATFDVYGVPVLYTPYFAHPDPSVERKTGFLPPVFRQNSYFGTNAQMPYYIVLDDQTDLTLTPWLSTEQAPQLYGEARRRFSTGEVVADGSITRGTERDDNNNEVGSERWRGHVRGVGRFRIDPEWRWGFNLFRTSDDTYLKRYDISNLDTLTSRAFIEGVDYRNYAVANAYSFQDLRSGVDDDQIPVILPDLRYEWQSDAGDYGGRYTVDASMVALTRNEGTDTRRLAVNGGWQLPYTGPMGDIYRVRAELQGAVYWLDAQPIPGSASSVNDSGTYGRLVPALTFDWRWPLVRQIGNVRQVLEPIAGIVLTPYSGSNSLIPNEDSQDVEFDTTNLFETNRFPGLDRWDGGPRFNYGVRTGLYWPESGYGEFFIGQSIRNGEDYEFDEGSGLRTQVSDIVMSTNLAPNKYFDLLWRARLDPRGMNLRRNEIIAGAGPDAFRVNVSYAKLDDTQFQGSTGDREAVQVQGNLRISKYWTATAAHLQDLGEDGGSLYTNLGLRYTDECFDLLLFADTSYFRNRDIQPETTFGFRFRLANLN
ncbi:LPS-assembly protein LptD [Marinibaculum pumilum]|uniref:LPS-assembly protein LptD n=1 Tax=Marinibaculum pumilum TaxID=1766165 RepID=A0ABV7KTP3_9PROT